MCVLENCSWKEFYVVKKYVAGNGNKMMMVKTKNEWLKITHRCNGNWVFEMCFN